MTTTPKVLAEYQDIPAAATDFYTSPASGKGTYADKLTSTNYSAGVVTVTIWLVPPSGSAGNSNVVVVTKSLAIGETYTFPEIAGKFISPGSKITGLCSAATSANFGASGREIT